MFEKVLMNPFTYVALALIALSVYGLLSKRLPEKLRNGLYIPLLLGTALLVYMVIRSPSEEPEIELVAGSFTVPAYQSLGIPYVNYMSFPITVDFVATGEWSTSGQYESRTGPEGDTAGKPADNRYRIGGVPAGSLIMQWKDSNAYEYAGKQKTVTLQPKQEILFLINDFKTEKAYSDNNGEVTLHWTCRNCRQR